MKKHNVPEIEAILFDFDNTIIRTSDVFFAATREVTQMYAQVLPALRYEQIARLFSEIDTAAHAVVSVNPNRWKTIIPSLEAKLGIKKKNSIADVALERLAGIYTVVPEFEPGAEEVLQRAREWGLLLGLVTHANVEWTLFKLKELGLEAFFDSVSIIDQDQVHKKPSDWSGAANRLPAVVENTMVVGDNKISDVIAAVAAGFGAAVWVHDRNGWELFREGDLPPQAYEIDGIAKVPSLPHFKKFS